VTWEKTWNSNNNFMNGISSNGNDAVFLLGTENYGRFDRGRGSITLLKNRKNETKWTKQIWSYPFTDVAFMNKEIGIAVGGWTFRHSDGGDVFLTGNGGKSWNRTFNPAFELGACFFVHENAAFICESKNVFPGEENSIFKSTDSGKNWITFYETDGFSINDIWFINENVGWAVGTGIDQAKIIRTADVGENWEEDWRDPKPAYYQGDLYGLFSVCFVSDTTGWAIGEAGLMVKYSNKDGWQEQSSVTDLPLNKVFFSDEHHGWIAGGYSNDNDFYPLLLKTIDDGESWQEIENVNYLINDIYFENNQHGWAVGADSNSQGVILESLDGGNSWNVQIEDLIGPLTALHFKDSYGWAVGELGLVLRTDNGVSWIDQINNPVFSETYHLFQNYPNPFNPKTVISYQLPVSTEVELAILNLTGQKVATLVSSRQTAGIHKYEWDASGLTSGLYFYRITAGQMLAQTKKLILLK